MVFDTALDFVVNNGTVRVDNAAIVVVRVV